MLGAMKTHVSKQTVSLSPPKPFPLCLPLPESFIHHGGGVLRRAHPCGATPVTVGEAISQHPLIQCVLIDDTRPRGELSCGGLVHGEGPGEDAHGAKGPYELAHVLRGQEGGVFGGEHRAAAPWVVVVQAHAVGRRGREVRREEGGRETREGLVV